MGIGYLCHIAPERERELKQLRAHSSSEGEASHIAPERERELKETSAAVGSDDTSLSATSPLKGSVS